MEILKVLVVDDEARMRKLVRDFLTVKGFLVVEAGDGEEAIDIFFEQKDIALILLDVMMPKMDGWEVCRTIRKYSQVPIIMLTARGEEQDELQGFSLGVDEYISKPFSPKILVARVEAILRRSSTMFQEVIDVGGIHIDKSAHQVLVDGKNVDLSYKEFELITYFAENQGIAETLCSYHKTFLGAAQKGLLPKPKCIVYTNLTCDANLLTFRTLADFYQVPVFAIDVPWNQTTENVQYVADQLRDLKVFLEKNTGKTISEDRLKERLVCSKRTLENYKKYQQLRADRYVPSDLVTPLYAGMTNNILLGTAEEEKYTQMLLEDIKKAPAAKGKHIYWMHTIPFWSDAVRQELCFSEKAQIVGCELAETCEPDFDPENPFEAMAERMVYHSLNGSALRRIEAGIRHAKQAGADGAVWFGHWGCKHTLGAAQLAKKKCEEAGLPLLILDGDGCDRSHGGEGQTSTRLGAFLEMLGGAENE